MLSNVCNMSGSAETAHSLPLIVSSPVAPHDVLWLQAFKRDLIIEPWRWVDKQSGTPSIFGGSYEDNTWVIQYFKVRTKLC